MLPATTVAPQALGVARGVTAATRRSMEGTRTGRGISPRYKRPVRQDDAGRGGVEGRGNPRRATPGGPLFGNGLFVNRRTIC
jgi:hypothetical protein